MQKNHLHINKMKISSTLKKLIGAFLCDVYWHCWSDHIWATCLQAWPLTWHLQLGTQLNPCGEFPTAELLATQLICDGVRVFTCSVYGHFHTHLHYKTMRTSTPRPLYATACVLRWLTFTASFSSSLWAVNDGSFSVTRV